MTAGPTYEKIDPVRFIGNYSSGKMGYALAEELANRGAEVTLVSGPTSLSTVHPNISRIDIESAEEMYEQCLSEFDSCDGAIMCAAVADYAPESCASTKIKRTEDSMVIKLKANPDIAKALGEIKKKNQLLIGFALETNNEKINAQIKLQKKNLDFIVLNSLQDGGAGFKVDTNKITILDNNGSLYNYSLKDKKEVARDIIDFLEKTSNV